MMSYPLNLPQKMSPPPIYPQWRSPQFTPKRDHPSVSLDSGFSESFGSSTQFTLSPPPSTNPSTSLHKPLHPPPPPSTNPSTSLHKPLHFPPQTPPLPSTSLHKGISVFITNTITNTVFTYNITTTNNTNTNTVT
ncbi:hypothetical protein Pcinc_021345 [Petrolisthes cinctipes]|uniref:Uncharacterized protein n=1 Tax=Petrolisthes cinctipes TaxID=88211 RepID=A0AAE1FGG7_PETCI|nr:hypothetical protein Pcinc_021345 [Petrolisthes cinctipes]